MLRFKSIVFAVTFLFISISMTNAQDQSCLNFDGNDRAVIPVAVSQSLGTNDFTFEAQINGFEDDVFHTTILSNRTGSINNGFHFFIHSYWGGSNHKLLCIRYNGINWFFIDNGALNDKVLDGECHHVAITKAGGTMTFYVDGMIIGQRENMPINNISTNVPILIGSDGLSSSDFNGTIDNVRIWSIARSQSEIQDGISNDVDPTLGGLLGYWSMSDGSGQTITDLTNQNDAILGSSSSTDTNDPTWGAPCCGSIQDICPDDPLTGTIDYTICNGESIVINNLEYNDSGTYEQFLLTDEGCDSILQVIIETAPVIDSMLFYNGCFGDMYSVAIEGITFDENNPTGSVTIFSDQGCEINIEVDLAFEDCTNCANSTPGLNLQILKSEHNDFSIFYARDKISLVKGEINRKKTCDYLMYISDLYNLFRNPNEEYYLEEEELLKLLSDMQNESVIKF